MDRHCQSNRKVREEMFTSVILDRVTVLWCLYNVCVFVWFTRDVLWQDAKYWYWQNGGRWRIRIFCFLKHEAGFSCSSELDHLSHLIGSPLALQILEMVDRISFKIYIECRDFFFFYCLLGPIKETKFMRLVIGSSDEFSFLFFFFRFIQFILVYVLKSFYLISSSVVLESKVLFFFFFFLFIINSFLYWMDLSKVFRLVFFYFI